MPDSATGRPLEAWFQDEASVGQKGWIPYQWAPIGSRPPAVRNNRHDSVYMFGAICLARGGRRRTHHVRCRYRGDERASERNQHAGLARRGCRPDLRWRRLASARQEAESSRRYHADPVASLFTGAQFDGEHLALPTCQQAPPAGVRQLRGHRHSLQECVAFSDQRPGSHQTRRNSRLGARQHLGLLVQEGQNPGMQVQHDRGVADEIAEIRGRYGVQ
jgi:hypothetical protein